MNEAELIELFKPCEELCGECKAQCCKDAEGKDCKALKDGKCASRNDFCLMHYCEKIEKAYPEIVDKIKKELNTRYPIAFSRGITPNFKWQPKKKE